MKKSSPQTDPALSAPKSESQTPAMPSLVEIEKPIYGGAFLARVEGKAVFIPLTLPGEQVRIRITQDKRGYTTAEAKEIITPAADRVVPACPHFAVCGGCQYQHAAPQAQLAFKEAILRETLERGGVPVPETIDVLAGEPWGYRNRIRLAFDAAGNPGYRGRASHAVVSVNECPIAAPVLMKAALAFAQIVRLSAPGLAPTEVALFCNADSSALLLTVFTTNAKKLRFDELAETLRGEIPALKGAELVLQSRSESRSAQPDRTVARWGATSITYHAAGFDYRVDQGAFFQVNRRLVDSLVDRVVAQHTGKLAWDLFAGVGLFARQLTKSFDRVIAVESAPSATQALTANLKGTKGIPVRAATLDFLRRPNKTDRPDLIVVDPPRMGLCSETVKLLAAVAAPALAYVSCDPATLARDLNALIASGYHIDSLAVADLFPQTFHLETVVHLRRP